MYRKPKGLTAVIITIGPSSFPVFMFCSVAVSGDPAGEKHDAADAAVVEA